MFYDFFLKESKTNLLPSNIAYTLALKLAAYTSQNLRNEHHKHNYVNIKLKCERLQSS